jgi:hypothetical protein
MFGKLKKIKLNGKRVRVSRDDNSPDGQCIGTPRPSFNFCHLHPNISDDSSTNDNKSPHLSLVENNHIPRCNNYVNNIDPHKPLCKDNFICSGTDSIHGVVNSNNNIYGVVNNTHTTYRATNKRNLRSWVRKNKCSNGYRSTSPIIIVDDSSVDNNHEPVNNSSILVTGLVCPLSSAIALLTTNFSMEILSEYFMSGGIQD